MERQRSELQISITSGEDGVRLLNIPEFAKSIPIYDFRNLKHHEMTVSALTQGKKLAMYGGVWAAIAAEKRNSQEGTFVWDVKETGKPGEIKRPQEAKPPVMMRPEDAVRMIDWREHHPEIASLSDFWNFRKLWQEHGAYLHIIAAIRPSFYSFPQRFKTTAQEFQARYPQFPAIGVDTFAVFWREDPSLRHFATLMMRDSHTPMYTAVTTLNPHQEQPPYTEEELFDDIRIRRCRIDLIDGIISDLKYENFRDPDNPDLEPYGSHTQIRLPFTWESPTFKVVRIGSLSPEGFEAATGFKCEVLPGVKDVRKHPGQNFDSLLEKMMEEIREEYSKQTQVVYCRFEKD